MDNSPDLAEQLKLIEEAADVARQHVDRARELLEHAERARRFWDDLADSLKRGFHAQALLLLKREADVVKELHGKNESAVERLRELHGQLRARVSAAAAAIGREFPIAARSAQIPIDSTSRHPAYTFDQGFLRLDIDERNFTATIAPRDGEERCVGLDVALIVETIRSQRTRLFERQLDASSFLRSLYTAYAAVLRTESRPEGD